MMAEEVLEFRSAPFDDQMRIDVEPSGARRTRPALGALQTKSQTLDLAQALIGTGCLPRHGSEHRLVTAAERKVREVPEVPQPEYSI